MQVRARQLQLLADENVRCETCWIPWVGREQSSTSSLVSTTSPTVFKPFNGSAAAVAVEEKVYEDGAPWVPWVPRLLRSPQSDPDSFRSVV
jgi:hypothetical protein